MVSDEVYKYTVHGGGEPSAGRDATAHGVEEKAQADHGAAAASLATGGIARASNIHTNIHIHFVNEITAGYI